MGDKNSKRNSDVSQHIAGLVVCDDGHKLWRYEGNKFGLPFKTLHREKTVIFSELFENAAGKLMREAQALLPISQLL